MRDDYARVEKQEKHNTGASLRSIPDGDKSKGEKIHGSTRGVSFSFFFCFMYKYVYGHVSFPLRIRPGIVASQKELLTRNVIHMYSSFKRVDQQIL